MLFILWRHLVMLPSMVLMTVLASIVIGITVTAALDCEELNDDSATLFDFGVTDAMYEWRHKIRDPKYRDGVGGPSDRTVSAELASAATIAAEEVCNIKTQLFVSKAHLPDLCRNVYVIDNSVKGNNLVDKIVKMDASLERYRYCPNSMKLLIPTKGPVESIDRDLIFQKGRNNKLAFNMRVFDNHANMKRYVAIIYAEDKGQKVQEFVGSMKKLVFK